MPILIVLANLLAGIAPFLARISFVMFFGFVFRLVLGFGFAIVSYKYVGDFFENMKSTLVAGYNSLPAALLALLDIGGFTTGFNIMFSGLSMIVGIWMAKSTLSILS